MTLQTTKHEPARLTPQDLLLSSLPGLLSLWKHDRNSESSRSRTALDLVVAWSGLQRVVLPDSPGQYLQTLEQIIRDDGALILEAILSHEFDCEAWQRQMEQLDDAWDLGREEAEELEWRTREAFDALDRTELLAWFATTRHASDTRVQDWLGAVRERCAGAERFLTDRSDLFLCLATDLAAVVASSRPELEEAQPLLWETLGKHRRIEEARDEVEFTPSQNTVLARVPRRTRALPGVVMAQPKATAVLTAAKTSTNGSKDIRLIETGFPCHQVGAETQRERGASSSLPPLYFLHVWWARRPLTPSRAAILASLMPGDSDPDLFLRQLGIEKVQALVNGEPWTLTEEKEFKRIVTEDDSEYFEVDRFAERWLQQENERRSENRKLTAELIGKDAALANDPVLVRWRKESQPLPEPLPTRGAKLPIRRTAADPAHVNERIAFAKSDRVKAILGEMLKWDKQDMYGYDRAYTHHPTPTKTPLVILDPTAGGGSIPFEAMRLGHKVIANELNPVATIIEYATLDYPARFGMSLADDIQLWGQKLVELVGKEMADLTPFSPLPESEREALKKHCRQCPEVVPLYDVPEFHQTGLLHVRQVTCPHCSGEAPLLNTCWLSKEEGDEWGVKIITDGKAKSGKVRFEVYRVSGRKGPNGEDPEFASVYRGDGTCVHCKQTIDGDEVKKQARGESPFGKWTDRLFCVVAVRLQPRLDKKGQPQRDSDNEIKTQKVTFFRPPNKTDIDALERAAERFTNVREQLEAGDLIPTEEIPPGHRSEERDIIFKYGINRWTDMFTPRQLLGHSSLIKHLKAMAPKILAEFGPNRGKALVTYLQLLIDIGLDYNSKQTLFDASRGIRHTFTRHDFSVKWAFGEMIFSGPTSGSAWCLYQVWDAYRKLAKLLEPLHKEVEKRGLPLSILNSTAAHLPSVGDQSVDLVCMDPPYYNNVQYAELSDYFYVWMRRTLAEYYPDQFSRRLTNKKDEAVANPFRDGGEKEGDRTYEKLMTEIFRECRRVMKDDGRLVLMFTHKSQEAWASLTRALIESGWTITSANPVESEGELGIHMKEVAAAVSSIFLTCRKRAVVENRQATWAGFGGQGVQQGIRTEVRAAMKEFEKLRLNPVDEMVAGYGRALRVLSDQWPVLDGDDPVSPVRAMNEASRVVAQYQIARLTGGRLKVDDLNPEAAMVLTLYGIYGLAEFPYDNARNIANSLGIPLQSRPGSYSLEGERMAGTNPDATSGRRRRTTSEEAEERGYHAPLISKGSKLRLGKPDERNPKRLENPQTEWDILHGLLVEYRRGDIPVARAYLNRHAEGRQALILDLLHVWGEEMGEETLRKDAQTLLFGLKSAQAS